MNADISKLAGWVPIRIGGGARPFVDWCRLGESRFTEPFFEQTIERCLQNPATLVFRRETSLDLLAEWPATEPGGFIFHMSRCGSTLVAQMLAALERHVVISEAPPIDAILRMTNASEERRVTWLRGLLGSFARPGCRVFVKFDAWHVLDLPLIRQAFPRTPWIFLHRDPVEVLVSQLRQRGALMVPGMTNFTLPEVDAAAMQAMPPEEYCSRVIERIFAAAIDRLRAGGGSAVDYANLPEAFFTQVATMFSLEITPQDEAAIRAVTQFNAKSPSLFFESDIDAKQRGASVAVREAAARWIREARESLRAFS